MTLSERPSRPFLAVAALLGLAALPGCEKAGLSAFERPPSPVTVVAAEKLDVPIYLDEIGKCVARESVSIAPQVSGRITEVHFADGADVKKGDPLFTIDPRPFQARLGAAQATLAQAQATLNLAKQEVVRIEKLSDPSAISQQDRDVKKNAVDTAEAQVLLAQSGVETATLDLEYCSIRSPIDGRAGHRLVDPGNVVMANAGTVLLVVQRLDPLFAEFTVIEEDLTSVQKSMSAGKLSAEVRFPDEPGSERIAELTFLDNAVQGSTGTVRLRATIPNADHRFWPGRFVKVRLVLGTIPGAVLVPETATQLSTKGPFVFVVKDDSTAELRLVTKGQRQGDRIVIEKGLEAGEKVVIEGQVGVMPGGKVRVVETPAAPAAPPSVGAGAAADPPPPAASTQKPPSKTPSSSGGGS